MAVYKVPQDVEAEDKLIGPFSFRQFIYLIVVAISGFLAFMLSKIFVGLFLIPLPVILFFGALALPLRKDQPMETYLAAMISFFLKPKKRRWKADGMVNLVEIVAPKSVEGPHGKDITQDDAKNRFDYLAQVMDSRGWSTRGVLSANDSVNELVMEEAAGASDILDVNTGSYQSMNNRLEEQEQHHRQEAVDRMKAAQVALANAQLAAPSNSIPQAPNAATPTYNPYPTMHQHVIDPSRTPAPVQATAPMAEAPPVTPSAQQPQQAPVQTSQNYQTSPVPPTVSPDILNLANNNDLSISAIAHEANRLEHKADEEVIISLR